MSHPEDKSLLANHYSESTRPGPVINQEFTFVDQTQTDGHVYLKAGVENRDGSRAVLGNCENMSPHHPHNSPNPRPNNQNGDTGVATSDDPPPPPGFQRRRGDWFELGRILEIWCPGSNKHGKQYVLLDTRNIEGLCLVVHGHAHAHDPNHDNEHDHHDDTFLNDHVLIQRFGENRPAFLEERDKIVYLSRRTGGPGEELWVHLGHTDNIDFERYHCNSRGTLDRKSLRDLRKWYLEWLAQRWDLDYGELK